MNRSERQVWITVSGKKFLVQVEDLDQNPVVAFVDGEKYEVVLEDDVSESEVLDAAEPSGHARKAISTGAGCQIKAPMPGDIVEIRVEQGQSVQEGDALCVLDAMKMKNTIHAPQEGRVVEICVQAGQTVEYGTPLIRLE